MGTYACKQLRCASAILAACALSLLMTSAPGFALAATDSATTSAVPRTVRVGLPESGVMDGDSSGSESTVFMEDYVQAVAQYANWNCEYVEGSWEECLQRLKSGDIDVLLEVSKTDERQANMDFSDSAMGTEVCYLYGKDDGGSSYGDYAAFDGMTVGCETGGAAIESLRELGADKGFRFTAKEYDTGAAMFAALDVGELDGVATSSFYEAPDGYAVLAECSPSPVYIATCKADPSLKVQLDAGMTQLLKYNPGFNNDIYELYFGSTSMKSEEYTRQELDYLHTNPVVDVYYESDWPPFEIGRNGDVGGITPDVVRAIGEDTGITFRFIDSASTQAIYEEANGASADTVMAVSYDYLWANNHDLLVTQPYITGTAMRVTKDSDVIPKTVAVVAGGYLAHRVADEFPDLEPIPYQTFQECMDAVSQGAADCLFLNFYQANYYRSMSSYEDYQYRPVSTIQQGISLGVEKGSNQLLLGILSKSLRRISADTLQNIVSENLVQSEPVTLPLLIKRYPVQTATQIGLLGLLLGIAIIMGATARLRKRENRALEAAEREAEAANRAKSEFLSRMSHDIRTPLNGIVGMTYLAKQQNHSEQVDDCLNKIDMSSQYLASLVNDVLDMAKAENGKIELHPEPYEQSELRSYLDAVVAPLCAAKGQKFVQDIQIPADTVPMLDKLRTNQILFNLLSNAVKYTPSDGAIQCSVAATPRADGKLAIRIRVADNGIGMGEEFRESLFQPFTREQRPGTEAIGGTGLGLSIVKSLVDALNGTINVESRVDGGTTFTIDFITGSVAAAKRADGGGAAEADDGADDAVLAGKRILVCEDNRINSEIVQELLAEKGMTVDAAYDGHEGLGCFAASDVGYYAAVLMDVRMPNMNGLEAARAIRALERPDAKTVPIIAMSADAFADDVQRCLDAGMNAHIAKPAEPAVLFKMLSEKIGKASQRR